MIKIDLKLFVTLSTFLPQDSDSFQIEEGTTVQMLIQHLGIPQNHVKLIFVNGKKQELEYQLQNNDRVGLFPPVGGG